MQSKGFLCSIPETIKTLEEKMIVYTDFVFLNCRNFDGLIEWLIYLIDQLIDEQLEGLTLLLMFNSYINKRDVSFY